MSVFSKFIQGIKSRSFYIASGGTTPAGRWNRGIEEHETCSAIIDCNATHIARGNVLHVVTDAEGRIKNVKRNSAYSKLFARPNPMMTRQDFLYALAWQLQVSNMAFAWIKWDATMRPIEVWPLVSFTFELRELEMGGYAVLFKDFDGQQRLIRTEDLVVVRRKFDGKGFVSRSNDEINEALGMTQAIDEGLKQALSISNRLHGILKQKKAMIKIDDKTAKETQERMKKASENGGILTLDAMEDYVPLEAKSWSANAEQTKLIMERPYIFLRTPLEVVKNTASEQMMQNFYDSIVEPVWEELGEAFTNAVFTRREQDFGNKMIVMSSAATGASWQTKLSIVRDTKEQGLLTTNEYRELLGYGPVEDGDDRLVSLNYIKASDQSKYQTGSDGKSKEGEEDNGETGQSNE